MSNFRVKVDLSNFYRDARQICWVYIDGTKIWQIDHVKKHIIKLFGIEEPFHLLLNDAAYLPPHEDVRILKEDELIVAVPGTGLKGEMLLSSCNATSVVVNSVHSVATTNGHSQDKVKSNEHFTSFLQESSNMVIEQDFSQQINPHKEVHENNTLTNHSQECTASVSQPAIDSSLEKLPTGDNKNDVTLYHSILEDTEIDGTTDSKATESNVTEDCSGVEKVSFSKRKRIRRKKNKKHEPTATSDISFEENKSKKPKIINSLIISAGKHIRFDNIDNVENNIDNMSGNEGSPKAFYQNTSFPTKDLSTLLALRQSSTPLTFARKATKQIKTENTLDSAATNDTSEEAVNRSANGTITGETQLDCGKAASASITSLTDSDKKEICEPEKEDDYLKIDPQKIPLMQSATNVGEIIAFKMLKIGLDYTPQVSDFIIAEILSYQPDTKVYNLKVIKGKDEIQVPMGKFTLPEDEAESVIHDTVSLNHAQLIEPRLLRSFKPATE